mmetsp:Transcript_42127/g.131096  ORF Transcript_42127/g.131096 Transcript_42127/m.131096 type:complete len:260 (-) Transcript_42127:46-825(-)
MRPRGPRGRRMPGRPLLAARLPPRAAALPAALRGAAGARRGCASSAVGFRQARLQLPGVQLRALRHVVLHWLRGVHAGLVLLLLCGPGLPLWMGRGCRQGLRAPRRGPGRHRGHLSLRAPRQPHPGRPLRGPARDMLQLPPRPLGEVERRGLAHGTAAELAGGGGGSWAWRPRRRSALGVGAAPLLHPARLLGAAPAPRAGRAPRGCHRRRSWLGGGGGCATAAAAAGEGQAPRLLAGGSPGPAAARKTPRLGGISGKR